MVQKQKGASESTQGVPLQAAVRRAHICFERIIPDELDAEQHVRRALRGELIAAKGAGTRLTANEVGHVARMALISTKKWGSGFTVRCCFLDGSAKMQKKVRVLAKEWEKYANVKIKFVTKGPAEVRISFYADEGSWSAVGRDALNRSYFPLHQPTMNFGWVRDDSDPVEDRAVVLHEFGHALGCIHEHQAPTFDRKWNQAAVMKYFQGAPNFWDEEAIRQNVLIKYSPKGIQATRFDPKSIMLYAFDAELFSDGRGPTNQNSDLSPTDRTMIKQMYSA
ncbi:MAG: M12 family metallopeptidase [Burkholderiales bacterium]|nr:M12 family metallopeptidase [Burkholderiales bacterium]